MRILWVGDSPTVASGFSRCTRAVCDKLHAEGHEVHVLGINHFGDPHDYDYPIYPCRQPLDNGSDRYGVGRLPVLASRIDPDVIVLLNDPWNVPPYVDYYDKFVGGVEQVSKDAAERMRYTPIVGWMAVDAKHQDGAALDTLNSIAVWTEFAAAELKDGGYLGEPSVIPLGVDGGEFRPLDRSEARRAVLPKGVPEDAFIVGVVGRNQPRKRLDLTLQYFAEFARAHDNAWIYLHVAPTGDKGVDLDRLIRYHDLSGRVILSQPNVGHGDSVETLRNLYSAIDVYFTTTQGEGWGLPALEAMACGTPVLAPDWSGLGSWARDSAMLVECSATGMNAPLNSKAYTVGGVMDRNGAVSGLDCLYRSEELRKGMSERGIKLAGSLSWDRTAQMAVEWLESVVPARAAA